MNILSFIELKETGRQVLMVYNMYFWQSSKLFSKTFFSLFYNFCEGAKQMSGNFKNFGDP